MVTVHVLSNLCALLHDHHVQLSDKIALQLNVLNQFIQIVVDQAVQQLL